MWSWNLESIKSGSSSTVTRPRDVRRAQQNDDVVLSVSEKFENMQIHQANDMVIEYASEVVRPIVADIREARCYDSLVGAGTYMFQVDDERVVDATQVEALRIS